MLRVKLDREFGVSLPGLETPLCHFQPWLLACATIHLGINQRTNKVLPANVIHTYVRSPTGIVSPPFSFLCHIVV